MKTDVQVVLNGLHLERNTAEFQIKTDGKRVGTLRVGTGSLVWVPYDRTYGYRVSWPEFDEIVKAFGDREQSKAVQKRSTKMLKRTNGNGKTPKMLHGATGEFIRITDDDLEESRLETK